MDRSWVSADLMIALVSSNLSTTKQPRQATFTDVVQVSPLLCVQVVLKTNS